MISRPARIRSDLRRIYSRLRSAFGPQHWWPGETSFEVAVGAILTQNTAWDNVASVIQRMKKDGSLSPQAILKMPQRRLASRIRSSGYFNQKAKKLKVFVRHLCGRYGGRMKRMGNLSAQALRVELLSLWGIGPETADSILLYALERPVFVVDAYTRRILARHSLISWDASYSDIQRLFMDHLPSQVVFFNEYHALLVGLGKRFCHKSKPNCLVCPIRTIGRLRLEVPAQKKAKRRKVPIL